MDEKQKISNDLESDALERERIRTSLSKGVGASVNPERSLSKTTKVVNRLKRFYTESNLGNLISDLRKLDWSPYIAELIDAMMESFKTMKLRDSFAFVEICCHFQSLLSAFAVQLVEAFRKQLDSCVNDPLRLRIYLRCITELKMLGVLQDNRELASVFDSVILFDADSTASGVCLIRLQALAFWLGRYGKFVCSDFDESFRLKIETFYTTEAPKIVKSGSEEVAVEESKHVQIRIDKGQLDAETEAKYAGLKGYLEKIFLHLKTVQSVMGFEELPFDELQTDDDKEECAQDLPPVSEEVAISPEEMQFSDLSEKGFYLDLLDVSARLPSALLEKENQPSSGTLNEFMARLDACSSREAADALSLGWFEEGIACKQARKQLVQKILDKEVSSSLVRFVANIQGSLGSETTQNVALEVKKRMSLSGENLKSRQFRAVKTYAELCKFGIAPPGPLLDLLVQCANDLSTTNGELAAWILVACGRFLINKPETKSVTENLLSRVMKLKNASTFLSAKVQMALEDAYFQTKPKLVSENPENKLTDIQRYVVHLITVEVYRLSEEALLQLVKRLPWTQDPLVAITMREAILDLTLNVNFEKCDHLASLLAGLIKFQEEFVVDLIDDVFEQFQISFEKEDFRLAPTRVRLAKFIGELYVYKLIDSAVIFDTLFQLVGFRATSSFAAGEYTVLLGLVDEAEKNSVKRIEAIPEEGEEEEEISDFGIKFPEPLMHACVVDEPGWSHIRTILVSTIIMTVGEFFLRGSNRGKMLRFLVIFRRYVLIRGTHLLSSKLVNVINDMFDFLQVRKFDIRTDSLAKVNEELQHIQRDLEKRTRLAVGGDDMLDENVQEPVTDQPTPEKYLESSPSDSADEYEHRSEGIDAEAADFDREIQAIMVESLSEAKSKKHGPFSALNLAAPSRLSSQSSDNDDPAPVSAKFKVLSKSQSGKPVSNGSVSVPLDHRLLRGQEEYRKEREAAAKEKEKLKRFIMAYERDTHAATQPAPRIGHGVTLAGAAGIRNEDDFDNKLWKGNFERRSKFKKI